MQYPFTLRDVLDICNLSPKSTSSKTLDRRRYTWSNQLTSRFALYAAACELPYNAKARTHLPRLQEWQKWLTSRWRVSLRLTAIPTLRAHPSRLPTHRAVVVNLEKQADGLGRQFDSTRADEEWLEDILFPDVRDHTFAHVDARGLFAEGVPVPQLGHDADWVETCVLCERSRDDFESLGVGLETVGFHSFEGLGVRCQGP